MMFFKKKKKDEEGREAASAQEESSPQGQSSQEHRQDTVSSSHDEPGHSETLSTQPEAGPSEGEKTVTKKGFFARFRKRDEKPEDQADEARIGAETPPSEGDPRQEEPSEEPAEGAESEEKKPGFFSRLRDRLTKTRKAFANRVDRLLLGKKEIDEELLEELEEVLITSDIGVHTAMALIEEVRGQVERKTLNNPEELKGALQKKILEFLKVPAVSKSETVEKPQVIMVVGVNGVGKTTTIGKLAAHLAAEGKKVVLVAGDTFRAAAVEQLEIWAGRVGAEIIRHKGKSDPSAVAFDGIQAALSRNADVVIIDTAGRLHTKVNLMEELKKMRRTVGKLLPRAPHETFLVLDATTGQNAISQAQLFHEAIEITGIVLTKLDGTAKGGVVVGICHSLGVPLRYIGIGEKVEDLQPFDPEGFMNALF